MPDGRNVGGQGERSAVAGELRSISLVVPGMDAALPFFTEAFGLGVRFRDGDRWVSLATEGLSVALTTVDQHPDGAAISFNVRVGDVDAALERLCDLGATRAMAATRGEHEVRAAVRTPGGHLLSVYQPV